MGSALPCILRICCLAWLLTAGGCHLVFPFEINPDSQGDRSDLAPSVDADADRPDLGLADQASKDAPVTIPDSGADGPVSVTDGGPVADASVLPDTVPWPDAALPDTVPPDTVSSPDGYSPPLPQLGQCQKLSVSYTGAKDDGPHLSTDGRRLYFSSARPGGPGSNNIWWAERPSLGSPFGAPQLVPGINKKGDQTDPSLDKYELVIVFELQEKGKKDIFQATRTSRLITFDPPVVVSSLKTPDDDEDPSLSPDGLTIVFSSNRAGGMGDNDLYIATRSSRILAFGNITPLVTVNSSDKDADPSFGGPHYLVFDSHRGGLTTPDLFIAVRTGWGASFGVPTPITSLNTNDLDGDPFLEPNTKRFLYEHGPSGGDTDIYECTY